MNGIVSILLALALLTAGGSVKDFLPAPQTEAAAEQTDEARLIQENRALKKEIADMQSCDCLSMPLRFSLPEGCSAAEVGGVVYISRRDGTAQAVLRELLASEGTFTRQSAIDYLLTLFPQQDSLQPAVEEFDFKGGSGSHFSRLYTEEDGSTMYGEFCVLEVEGSLYLLEVQSSFMNRQAAWDTLDGLLSELSAK